ncbi:radial spoke head protein 9 homolog [Ischnura elegans]|uniref:radial spoke head protein 9 homolog n=1 Tax=Ischnura elegans TaxID=197161 RepID=UPI001ED88126|nr:radial spoke head protein 9 homolog [Ischnura elegans]
MDARKLLVRMEIMKHTGNCLTTEECVILENSLVILQNENHFHNVYFWGKIYGTERNYYISFGYQKDALADITFYYSTDCVNWSILPLSTEIDSFSLNFCANPFTGDPAVLTDTQNILSSKETVGTMKEEDRLAATVSLITEETMIVPRGALFKNIKGVVIENENFRGLNKEQSKHLESYAHYRVPQNKWNTNLLKRADYSYEMDFLDTIDMDIPKDCWSLQFENRGKVIVIRNMFWMGMSFTHVIGTPEFYYNYSGNGKKNVDVPFML